jgi:hypothetical protein
MRADLCSLYFLQINSIKGGLFIKPLPYKDLRLIFMPFEPDTFNSRFGADVGSFYMPISSCCTCQAAVGPLCMG